MSGSITPTLARVFVLGAVLGAARGDAQAFLNPNAARVVAHAFDSHEHAAALNCSVQPLGALLTFAFRFRTGFEITCPVRLFDGKSAGLNALIRVTPDGGQPVMFGEGYRIPAMPADLSEHVQIDKVKTQIAARASFIVGEGSYKFEVLLVDNRQRVFRKHWRVSAARKHGEQEVGLADPPATVSATDGIHWSGPSENPDGLRVTVLLHAAPLNPDATQLHAWDRASLLDALSSVLRLLPCRSVRVTAFNLDQQRILFSTDSFQAGSFRALDEALRQLELGAVSYKVLQDTSGWSDLLESITAREVETTASDIVVFLGPHARIDTRTGGKSQQMAGRPPIFYLEIYPPWRSGSEFPDAIEYGVSAYGGKTVRVLSPADLSKGIARINESAARQTPFNTARQSHSDRSAP